MWCLRRTSCFFFSRHTPRHDHTRYGHVRFLRSALAATFFVSGPCLACLLLDFSSTLCSKCRWHRAPCDFLAPWVVCCGCRGGLSCKPCEQLRCFAKSNAGCLLLVHRVRSWPSDRKPMQWCTSWANRRNAYDIACVAIFVVQFTAAVTRAPERYALVFGILPKVCRCAVFAAPAHLKGLGLQAARF